MKKSILVFSLFLSVSSFASNKGPGGGGDAAIGSTSCIRGNAQQAEKFYEDTVEIAKQLKLNLSDFKGDIERGVSEPVSKHILSKVRSVAVFESSLCVYRLSETNSIGGAESMAGRLSACDADHMESRLRSKTEKMIGFANSHKESFLQAIASGSRQNFVSKVASGNCN